MGCCGKSLWRERQRARSRTLPASGGQPLAPPLDLRRATDALAGPVCKLFHQHGWSLPIEAIGSAWGIRLSTIGYEVFSALSAQGCASPELSTLQQRWLATPHVRKQALLASGEITTLAALSAALR